MNENNFKYTLKNRLTSISRIHILNIEAAEFSEHTRKICDFSTFYCVEIVDNDYFLFYIKVDL